MSTSKGPINVALAGAGNISLYHLTAWRKLGERVRVVAVCDPDLDRARKRAAEFGVPHAFRDAAELFASGAKIDALDVASPRETHAAWIEDAAARGIDVLSQKPLCPTLAEAGALVRRVRGKMRLMVHENWRFRPWYRELRRWVDAGELGDINMAQISIMHSGLLPDAEGRRTNLERQPFAQFEPRLMLAEVLIHHIDTMRFLFGPLRVVAARARRTVPDVTGETVANVLLETATGAPVSVLGSNAAPGYPAAQIERLELVGTKASAIFADYELKLLSPKPRSERYTREAGYQGSFDGVIAHFIDCLETGAPFETDPDDNLETLRLTEHAYWAAGRHNPAGGP